MDYPASRLPTQNEGMISKYCVFCYKCSLTEPDNGGRTEEAFTLTHLRQFYLNCHRYLKIPEQFNEHASSGGTRDSEVPCDMCWSQVTSFNELYHEMKYIELKLQMKLRGLLGVMRDAGKVVSRKKSLIRALGTDKFHEVVKRRKDWFQYCSEKLQTCFPRVILEDISMDKSKSRNTLIDKDLRQQTAAQWLISLAVVAVMLIDSSIVFESADGQIDDFEVDTYFHVTCSNRHANCELVEDCHLETDEESSESNWVEEAEEEKFPLKDDPTDVESQETERNIDGADRIDKNSSEQANVELINNAEDHAKLDCNNGNQITVVVQVSPSTELNEVERHQITDKIMHRDQDSNEISATESISHEHEQDDDVVMDNEEESGMIENDSTLNSITGFPEDGEQSSCKTEVLPKSNKEGLPTSKPIETESTSSNMKTGKYNLRRRSVPVKTRFSDSESEVTDQDQDDEYKQENESNETPVSSESEVDSLEEVFSKALIPKRPKCVTTNNAAQTTTKGKYKKRITAVESGFSCFLDGCNFQTRGKQTHESHLNLHKLGLYKCNFCVKAQVSPMLLSIHETTEHATKTAETNDYICARCPFTTPYFQVYVCHFASDHLSISGLEKCTPKTCEICKIPVMAPKRHHRLVHTNPGDDANQVICPEENCAVIFRSRRILQLHCREYHHRDKEIDDMEVDIIPIQISTSDCAAKCKPIRSLDQEAQDGHGESDENGGHKKCVAKDVTMEAACGYRESEDDHGGHHVEESESCETEQVTVFVQFTPTLKQNAENQQVATDGRASSEECETLENGEDEKMAKVADSDSTEDVGVSTSFGPPEDEVSANFKLEQDANNSALPPQRIEQSIQPSTSRAYNLRKRCAQVRTRFSDSESDRTDGDEYKQESESSDGTSSSESDDSNEGSFRENLREVVIPNKRKIRTPAQRSPESTVTPTLKKSGRRTEFDFVCLSEGCNFHTRRKETNEAHRKLHQAGSFPCQFCDKVEASPALLSIHESTEHTDKSSEKTELICSRCPFTSAYHQIYVCHFATEHLSISGLEKCTPKACEICKITVLAPKRHHRLVHGTTGDQANQITCPQENCIARLPNQIVLEKHSRDFHKINVDKFPFRCGPCDLQWTSEKRLRAHVNTFHQNFPCPLKKCPKTFRSSCEADRHAKLHGLFTCSKCKFVTGYAPTFIEHDIKCVNKKTSDHYSCPDCKFEVNNMRGMIKHRLEKHLKASLDIFSCSHCSETFPTDQQRNKHESTHPRKRNHDTSFRCKKCMGLFVGKLQLKTHVNVCNKRRTYRFNRFFRYIANHEEYRRNAAASSKVTTGNEERQKYCAMCQEDFRTEKDLEDHSKWHGTWPCSFCPVKKEFAPDLALHEVENHAKQSHKCPRCKWRFKATHGPKLYNVPFVKHFLSEHLFLKTDMFACEKCRLTFLTYYSVREHERKCFKKGENQDNFEKCDECPAYFETKIKLLSHKKANHVALTCKECNKDFGSATSLNLHINLVHRHIRIACDEPSCRQTFNNAEELATHKEKCRRKPAVNCETCGKAVKGEIAMRRHIKLMHGPDRQTEWKCNICGKTFKLKVQLQIHEEYHKPPEAWKYMCTQCPKKSATQQKLNEHMRTHTNEKPFVCQVCGMKYAHRHNLQIHMKSKHDEVEFQKKKHVQRVTVSRKGKKLGGLNFCFTREKDLEGGSSSDLESSD